MINMNQINPAICIYPAGIYLNKSIGLMEGKDLACSIQVVGDITIVTLETSDLGKRNAKGLKAAIAREVDFAHPVIVDFGVVEYFDCSGLSLIVHWLAE